VLALIVGKACLPYFPTFSVDPKPRESLRLAFPISLRLVLNLSVRKVFAMPSFMSLHLVQTLNVGKKILWGNTSLFPYVPFSLQLGLPQESCMLREILAVICKKYHVFMFL